MTYNMTDCIKEYSNHSTGKNIWFKLVVFKKASEEMKFSLDLK